MQPSWTIYLFKVSFSLYMLVSVIVLINLLIAMMSDTYQSIQSQSDIEWKYGLTRLIRNMQKTRTAPPPWNLASSWIPYIVKGCINRCTERKPGVMHLFTGHSFSQDNGLLSHQRDTINFPLIRPSPLDSTLSLRDPVKIENIVEWERVRRKYRVRFMNEVEKPLPEDSPTTNSAG